MNPREVCGEWAFSPPNIRFYNAFGFSKGEKGFII